MSARAVSNKLLSFGRSLVGNRVFDVYLKYMGIKTLTTATLVPVALIAGKQAMEDFLAEAKQTGGANLPVLDDPLVGNYLKLAGLSTLNVSLNTLVPLGTLMLVYELVSQNALQQGGNISGYVKKAYGNRVLDLFAKYKGLKTLTSATLVPFALIYGKDVLESVLLGEQTGGAIPEDLPVLDDPLLGNYLKLAGLSTMSVTLDTLVPLGILMAVYQVYMQK